MVKNTKPKKTKGVAVDKADSYLLEKYNWRIDSNGYVSAEVNYGGTRQNRNRELVYLHRLIQSGATVDHINGNKLDNTRRNLREVNASESAINTVRQNKTGYRGVHKAGNKYVAEIQKEGEKIRLGRYGSAIEAAYVRDQFALQLFGRNPRWLNVL